MPSVFVKRTIILALCGIGIIIVLYNTGLADSCPIRHVQVMDELKKYQENLDPEYCEDLLEKITDLNNQCNVEIEIIDCG
jgi:hypothetical protein